MFCPGCGERNDDTDACCTKCGLDLARLRIVFAEDNRNKSGAASVIPIVNGAFPYREPAIDDEKSDNSPQGNVEKEIPAETAGLNSPDPAQLKELGNELFRQEKFLDALDYYEKALAIDQFYVEAWYNKSIVLKKIGRQDQSKVCWGIYKRLSSGVPEAQKNRHV